MAEASGFQVPETSVVQTETSNNQQSPPPLKLKLKKPKNDKKVQWDQGTVDNEHMNKKKSKCCCIYEKPKVFGESSSEDSDSDGGDCSSNCRGHKKKCFRKIPESDEKGEESHGNSNSQKPSGMKSSFKDGSGASSATPAFL